MPHLRDGLIVAKVGGVAIHLQENALVVLPEGNLLLPLPLRLPGPTQRHPRSGPPHPPRPHDIGREEALRSWRA